MFSTVFPTVFPQFRLENQPKHDMIPWFTLSTQGFRQLLVIARPSLTDCLWLQLRARNHLASELPAQNPRLEA